jgi:hypothetical protein
VRSGSGFMAAMGSRGVAGTGHRSRSSRSAVCALPLGALLIFHVRLDFPGVRLGLLVGCLIGFPDLIGLLLDGGLGPRAAGAPEAREAEHGEKPQRP